MAWVGAPEYLNTQTYPAVRDRVVLSHLGSQHGVYNDTDFLVAPSSLMTLSVQPGDALVKASHPTLSNKGYYHVNSDAVATATIPTAHGSLPRLDQVVLVVQDPSYDPTLVSSAPIIQVVQGTATSGATLDNRSGAASTLPASSLRLADVLVPAGASSIAASAIRDRRPWSRGCFKRVVVTSGETTASSSTDAPVVAGRARCELTGEHPIEVTLQGSVYTNNSTGTPTYARLGVKYYTVDVGMAGSPSFMDGAATSSQMGGTLLVNTQKKGFTWRMMNLPLSGAGTNLPSAVGSVMFEPFIGWYEPVAVGFNAIISGGSAADPLTLVIREVIHGNDITFPSS